MKVITITLEFDDESITDAGIYKYLDELMEDRNLAYDMEIVEDE